MSQGLTRGCGFDLYRKILLEKDGERFRTNMKREEQNWLRFASTLSRVSIEQPVVTIPVVVHIVYNKENQNLPDPRIYSQVEVASNDFRKKNTDKNKVPDVWKDIAADARIEFMLARRDPEGNPTNAITRTRTDIDQFVVGTDQDGKPYPENIKSTNIGGKDPWDTTRYLNIWVCNIRLELDGVPRDLLGYAQPPGADPKTDGVVIYYDAFGINVNRPDFGLGRTVTHEVGHYLGLKHIWGDDFNALDPDNPEACEGPDNIQDTPNQKGSNHGKPTFPSLEHSCPNTGPNGTMFMNYMDYTHDDSMYMFTLGQTARMRATLSDTRSTLVQPNVLRCPKEESHLEHLRILPPKVYNGVDSVVEIEKLLL
jgi:hypothetical protein